VWPSAAKAALVCASCGAARSRALSNLFVSVRGTSGTLALSQVFSRDHPQSPASFALPATAFGRAVLFSFFGPTHGLRPGLLSAAPPGLEFADRGGILDPVSTARVGRLARGGARSTLLRRVTQGLSTAQIVLSNDPAPLGMTEGGSEVQSALLRFGGTDECVPSLHCGWPSAAKAALVCASYGAARSRALSNLFVSVCDTSGTRALPGFGLDETRTRRRRKRGSVSFAPFGACSNATLHPRLTPWAAFFRRLAARTHEDRRDTKISCDSVK